MPSSPLPPRVSPLFLTRTIQQNSLLFEQLDLVEGVLPKLFYDSEGLALAAVLVHENCLC